MAVRISTPQKSSNSTNQGFPWSSLPPPPPLVKHLQAHYQLEVTVKGLIPSPRLGCYDGFAFILLVWGPEHKSTAKSQVQIKTITRYSHPRRHYFMTALARMIMHSLPCFKSDLELVPEFSSCNKSITLNS